MNFNEFKTPSMTYISSTSYSINKLFVALAKGYISNLISLKKVSTNNSRKFQFNINENTHDELLVSFLQTLCDVLRLGYVPIKYNISVLEKECNIQIICNHYAINSVIMVSEDIKYSMVKIEKNKNKLIGCVVIDVLKRVNKDKNI